MILAFFKILLFLDRYFGVFGSDLPATPVCLVMECPPGTDRHVKQATKNPWWENEIDAHDMSNSYLRLWQ